MPSMSEIISEHTDLSESDHHWLKLLVSEWQLLADLSFSDLVLWVLDRDPNVFWAAAQIRPFTGAHTAPSWIFRAKRGKSDTSDCTDLESHVCGVRRRSARLEQGIRTSEVKRLHVAARRTEDQGSSGADPHWHRHSLPGRLKLGGESGE